VSGQPTDQTRSRRESRERAVELAYEAEVRECTVDEIVASQTIAPEPFVVSLLKQGEEHREAADALIDGKSDRWSISRMAVLDLVVMRLAVAELLADTTPTGVVLSEAVELAGRYSTDDSGKFVNGILAAIASEVREKA
jgi:N utilization substance protein B